MTTRMFECICESKKMRKLFDTEPSPPLSFKKGFDAYYFKTQNFPSQNDKKGNNFSRLHGRSSLTIAQQQKQLKNSGFCE
jgi:hypothetical protein